MVLIGANLFRALLVASLIWPQGVWHAYLVAAGLAAGDTFFNPAFQAVIPALTSEDQRLAANSVAWSTGRLVQILASAVAGGLIALLGTGAACAVNAASFGASALLIATLAIPAHAGQVGAGSTVGVRRYMRDARAGLRFALRERLVSRLLLVQALASFAVGATGALLVVLAERHLRLVPVGFAWLIGTIGAGALLGPLLPNTRATTATRAGSSCPTSSAGWGTCCSPSSPRCRWRCRSCSSTACIPPSGWWSSTPRCKARCRNGCAGGSSRSST